MLAYKLGFHDDVAMLYSPESADEMGDWLSVADCGDFVLSQDKNTCSCACSCGRECYSGALYRVRSWDEISPAVVAAFKDYFADEVILAEMPMTKSERIASERRQASRFRELLSVNNLDGIRQ